MNLASIKIGSSVVVQADVTSELNAILPYFTPKFQAELKVLFPEVEQGLKDGVIASKIVQRFTTLISKASEFARSITIKAVKKLGNPHKTEMAGFGYKEKFYDIGNVFDGGYYKISQPKEFIKKFEPLLAPLSQEYPEFGKALSNLIKMAYDLVPVYDLMDKLEDIKTNKSIEKYRPPQAKIQTMKSLYDILDKFMVDTRAEMVDFWEKNISYGANLIVLKYGSQVLGYKTVRDLPQNYMALIDYDHDSMTGNMSKFRLKADWKTKASKIANAIADGIKEGFLAKSVHKLASIVENRGDYASAEKTSLSFHSGAIEGHVTVKFQNGDSFAAYLQVVSVVNQQGTAFSRYPLTFHDVKIGGKVFKMVTEEWMNKNFRVGAAL